MARRNSFDFAHTCPKIDKAIAAAKHTIQSYLKDYINDLCPYIPDEKAIELSNDWGETIYNDISDCFESVRETNEDMRREWCKVVGHKKYVPDNNEPKEIACKRCHRWVS